MGHVGWPTQWLMPEVVQQQFASCDLCYGGFVRWTAASFAQECQNKRKYPDNSRAISATGAMIFALSFPAKSKSDVFDFARLASTEVGQGRFRVKAVNPAPRDILGYWMACF